MTKPLQFDAQTLARGWLSVAVASGADKDRPALNRTISVELFDNGARLIATDSYILLRSWVPAENSTDPTEPDWGDAPERAVVAVDAHGRAKGFLAHLYNLTTNGDDPPQLTVDLDVVALDFDPDGTQQATLDTTMNARYLVLDEADSERLRLPLYEGPYIDWRTLDLPKTVRTDAVALNPEFLARLGKLAKWHRLTPLLWRFAGRDKAALIEVADAEPTLTGLVMPVRWDFDRDAPAEAPE